MYEIIDNITLSGDQHRKQRKLLNPVFNVKHMRYMIPIFYAVARQVPPLPHHRRTALK
jgi:cytochrome P450